MKVQPGSNICLASSESATLELLVDVVIAKARLHLVDASCIECDAVGNEISVPSVPCPNAIRIEWFAEGDDTALFETYVEVCSRHYFRIEQLRGYGNATDDFSGKSDDELFAARQAAAETFERNASRSFVRRIGETRVFGEHFAELDHCDVQRIVSPDGWKLVSDCQARFYGPSPQPCSIRYVYGTCNVPVRVSNAVLQLAAYYLRDDVTPSRATGEATEAGFLRFTVAGRDGATGLPEIDAVIEQFGRRRFGVA